MSVVDNTCRTCGKPSEQEDCSDLHPMYTSIEYNNELKMIQEEFEIWNLNISKSDGLPQKICLTCFDSFCQIHNFRLICQEAQMNFGELCTGLDIIIKVESENGDVDIDHAEDFEGEQTITVQEHYRFPGDSLSKLSDPLQEAKQCEDNLNTVESSETFQIERDPEDVLPKHNKYQCEYCMDVVAFDDLDLLNNHYNIKHSTDFPYECPKCEKCFDTKRKQYSHAKVHFRNVVECTICSKNVRGGKQMMAEHIEFHHIEKDRECTTCGKKFKNISLKRFNYHMGWHNDAKLHKCKFCDKKFIQGNHLVIHERTHTGENPFLCSECGKGFKHSNLMYTHMKKHGKGTIPCTLCDETFFSLSGYKLHMIMHNRNGGNPTRCEICDRTYSTMHSLRLHNHKKHGEPATPGLMKILKKNVKKKVYIKPYKCAKCPESFVLHQQLSKHLKIHDEIRPHKCDRCHKSFKLKVHLNIHVKFTHLNKKPHKCPVCEKLFTQNNHLREHFATKHEEKRDFKCTMCDAAFAVAKGLKSHMIKHRKTKPFTCTICNRSFIALSFLKDHVNSHLKKNEADVAGGDITDIVVNTT